MKDNNGRTIHIKAFRIDSTHIRVIRPAKEGTQFADNKGNVFFAPRDIQPNEIFRVK